MKQAVLIVLTISLCVPFTACAQQQVDHEFSPKVEQPLYASGTGPVITVDAGHYNFHTLADKYAPFGRVAEADGFRLRSLEGEVQPGKLEDTRILVIANALNEKNTEYWRKPVHQAFTPSEIETIVSWVKGGGRLFLIADHMPFAGAVSELAAAMGFQFYDGFAMRKPKRKYDQFSTTNGMLKVSELTSLHGRLDSIVSFTGQAFRISDSAVSVITLDSSFKVLMPEEAWEFNDKMEIIPAEGMSQLAYGRFGAGKVVIAGEAAMFTAQRVGDVRIGLGSSFAPHNLRLLRNILEWLNK